MYLITVNKYVETDLKVISISFIGAKQEQGSIQAVNLLRGGLFSPSSNGNTNLEIGFW